MMWTERRLKIETGHATHNVVVTLSAPSLDSDGGWFCAYRIGWPDGAHDGRGWGIDGCQALGMTLQLIGAHLYASPYHEAGHLVWERRGGGYGFPVPPSLRDRLVGQDRDEQI